MQNREQTRDRSIDHHAGFGLGQSVWSKVENQIIENAWAITWVLMISGQWVIRQRLM